MGLRQNRTEGSKPTVAEGRSTCLKEKDEKEYSGKAASLGFLSSSNSSRERNTPPFPINVELCVCASHCENPCW